MVSSLRPPLFSVVIPVYNRAHLIGRAIRSVRAQTCQDFEIVVVDDGSSDDIEKAIESIDDSRVILYRQVNKGASAARNEGVRRSDGIYVAFLDSDDAFLPHHLETMSGLLKGREGTVAYAAVLVDRGDAVSLVKPPRALRPDEDMATYLMCDRGFVQTSGLVLPRAAARDVTYREDTSYGDDTDFAVRLHLAGYRFVMAPSPGVVWYDHFDPQRLSSNYKNLSQARWLEDLRSQIPEIAYLGYRGWHVAKGLAAEGRVSDALLLYFRAALRGAYRPKLALLVLTQIVMPEQAYRRTADIWLRFNGRLHPAGGDVR